MDLLVIKRPPAGGKAKIVEREEVKTGLRDTHASADAQLTEQSKWLSAGASGKAKVRLERNGRDVTDDIDLSSDATAKKATRGPANRKFDESLRISSLDLEALFKELLRFPPSEDKP